jgi:hypothetical protein
MTNLNDHLRNETNKFRMTDSEKAAMRARLTALMSAVPSAPAAARIPSPYVRFFAPRSVAVFSLALIVLLSTGTAYAAEGSLPGGVFWPVKTAVIEPLTIALASTPAQKAEVNAQIAAKRVAEAQTLAAQGALTSETAEAISINYTAHATAALALAKDADDISGAATSTPVQDDEPAGSAASNAGADTTRAMEVGTHSDDTPAAQGIVTFSARTTALPMQAPAPTAPATTTTLKKASLTAQSASSTTASPARKRGLSGKLNAALSAQAQILKEIGVQVHVDAHTGVEDASRDND